MCSVRQEPDPVHAETLRHRRVLGRVGIGAHADVARQIGPVHQRGEGAAKRRFHHLGRAHQHLAGGAVDG